MIFNDIYKIIFGVVASVGGIGAVIIACIKFASGMIATRLEQKYSVKVEKELESYRSSLNKEFESYKATLDKELEQYRAALESKNYVSKTRFDTEFSIFRKLNELTFNMVRCSNTLVPAGYAQYPANETARKKYEEKCYEQCAQATNLMRNYLYQNSPFFPKSFYDSGIELLSLCTQQIDAYTKRFDVLYIASKEDKESFTLDDYKRAKIILDKYDLFVDNIRIYLSTLDVI